MNLYIDFDGVILDTVHFYMDILNECVSLDEEVRTEILSKLDWNIIINQADEINDSVNELKKIVNSKLFNVFILTHVNSINEANEKKNFIRNNGLDIPVIHVFKNQKKSSAVDVKNSILIDDDIENIIDFEEQGGTGIYFSKNFENYPVRNIEKLGDVLNYENIESF